MAPELFLKFAAIRDFCNLRKHADGTGPVIIMAVPSELDLDAARDNY